MTDEINKDDESWREELSEDQYLVTRKHHTERPFSGEYNDCKTAGVYTCVCCGEPLFSSQHKYDSGSGWPSYWLPINNDAVGETEDNSHGMTRVEVHCNKCQAHLGHVFPDGPPPTGLRYCINSLSLKLVPEDSEDTES